ncbi:MAG: phosphoglycolate phosphatase [Methanomicrobia archaeon]|nr:phosphoglycolate phosphatase [Methanomicrobia archaeon]
MIKSIVSDIDGTLTDEKRRINIDAIKALREAEEAGFKVSLCTGNILGFALGASKLIGTSGGVIAEDGGIIFYDSKIEVFGSLEEPLRCYDFIKEKADLLPTFLRRTGIVVYNISVNEILNIARKHELNIEISDSGFGIHIKNEGINKGTALKNLAELMKIDLKETVYIGDNYNDIPAFEVAGYRMAVKNAVKELKEKADYITKKSYGNGGAEAVRKIVRNY